MRRTSGPAPVRIACLVTALAVCVAGPAEGRGGAADAKKAARLEKKAKKAYGKKRWDDAIAAFEIAYQADPKPKFLFNIGRCYEQMGDLPRAIESLERYVAEVKDAADRDDGEDRLAILRKKLRRAFGRLSVRSTPSGADVRIESEARALDGVTPFDAWLPAGRYDVTVVAAGFEASVRVMVLRAGQEQTFEAKLERPPAPEPPPDPPAPEPPVVETPAPPPTPAPAAPPEPTAPPPGGTGITGVTWAVLGTGGALLAGGAVFGLFAEKAKADRDGLDAEPVLLDYVEAVQGVVQTNALVANVLFGAGAVAVLAGGVLVYVDTAEEGGGDVALELRPTPVGASLVLRGAL